MTPERTWTIRKLDGELEILGEEIPDWVEVVPSSLLAEERQRTLAAGAGHVHLSTLVEGLRSDLAEEREAKESIDRSLDAAGRALDRTERELAAERERIRELADALEKLRDSEATWQTEEATLLHIEVQEIARSALSCGKGETENG